MDIAWDERNLARLRMYDITKELAEEIISRNGMFALLQGSTGKM